MIVRSVLQSQSMATNNNGTSTRIRIPFDTLEDHIHCSICLSPIRGAVLTPCGHRYCNKCITEWTGRNHKCPCCNSDLTSDQFNYDVQFDSLVEQVLSARDEAEQSHFDKMFNQGTSINKTEDTNSPIQDIFKKHVKASFISFEKYFQTLREDHNRQIRLLEASLPVESADKNSQEDKKLSLQSKFELSQKLAMESFDRYLSTNIPSFEVLPVMVSIYVNDKKLRIHNVLIRPSDSLTAIKAPIEAFMQQRQDDVVSWTEQGEMLFLFGPLNKSEHYEEGQLLNGCSFCVQLSWQSQPVFQQNMLPGSEIVLHGAFKSTSDLPKLCFAQEYLKGGNHTVDYFSCQTCTVKWICKSCAQSCHMGHTTVPFILKHRPTWACCYCPKKKLCKIQDS